MEEEHAETEYEQFAEGESDEGMWDTVCRDCISPRTCTRREWCALDDDRLGEIYG